MCKRFIQKTGLALVSVKRWIPFKMLKYQHYVVTYQKVNLHILHVFPCDFHALELCIVYFHAVIQKPDLASYS